MAFFEIMVIFLLDILIIALPFPYFRAHNVWSTKMLRKSKKKRKLSIIFHFNINVMWNLPWPLYHLEKLCHAFYPQHLKIFNQNMIWNVFITKKRKPSFLAKSKTNYLITLPSESLDFGWHTFRTIAVLVLICSSETCDNHN